MQALQGNTSDAVWALLCPVSPCTHRPAPGRSGTPQGHPKTSYLKVAEVEEGCRAVGEAQGHLGAAGELMGRCLGRRTEGAASQGGTTGCASQGAPSAGPSSPGSHLMGNPQRWGRTLQTPGGDSLHSEVRGPQIEGGLNMRGPQTPGM